MGKNEPGDSYSEEEAARRRDTVVKAMIATTPHVRGSPAPEHQ
jgi:hypothetical protein